jgi:hypothetical protein
MILPGIKLSSLQHLNRLCLRYIVEDRAQEAVLVVVYRHVEAGAGCDGYPLLPPVWGVHLEHIPDDADGLSCASFDPKLGHG